MSSDSEKTVDAWQSMGDEFGSFDWFVRREQSKVLGLAYVMTGSRSAAEDLTQEAFLAAWHRWDEVARMENPGAWVRRVVANKSVSTVRRRIAEIKALRRHGPEQEVAFPELSAETEWLWSEVRRLPNRQLQVIVLHYLEEMTMPEISQVLGCSKESVNTHLRRARSSLARRLERGDV